ncbi:sensor histidine kinase [Thalassotalea piscium]
MLRTLLSNIPGYAFWFANGLFWIILNTISSAHAYRIESQRSENPGVFFDLWLHYLPWWGNWIFIAPLIIATTATISLDKLSIRSFIIKNILFALAIFSLYWGVTMLEVILIKGNTINSASIGRAFQSLLNSPLYMDFLVYLAIFGVGYAMSYHQKAQNQQVANQELSKQLLETELNSLKSQLNPHFLFNTLNTISSLVRLEQNKIAVKAIDELSKMLRKVLENHNKQVTSLADEIEFIKSYLVIQQLRFEDKLRFEINVANECLTYEIPFMLLQTLVENAVQHGSQLESNGNSVTLDINCDNQKLFIRLKNKSPETDLHKGFGIGIDNCRQRIEKLYKDQSSLTLNQLEEGYFETELTLPLKQFNFDK